jgi:hypothetical protein
MASRDAVLSAGSGYCLRICRAQRTSMLSLVKPVRISGPFCEVNYAQLRKKKATRKAAQCPMQWPRGDRPGQLIRQISWLAAEKKEKRTCNHLPCVVNDTLVVLVRAMRKVHADCRYVSFFVLCLQKKMEVDIPTLTPARRSSPSFSTVLTLGPEQWSKHLGHRGNGLAHRSSR